MFDDSVSTVYSSIWTSINSWFTPTVLFVLLNVMIATIAFTSSLANNHKQNQTQEPPKQQQQYQQQDDYSQHHSPQQQQYQQQDDYSQHHSPQQQQYQQDDFSQHHSPQQHHHQQQQQQQMPKITRSPSILQRIKSINFYNYRSQEPESHQQEPSFEPQTHYIFEPAPHEQSTIETETTNYIFNQDNVQKSKPQYDENLQESQTECLFQEQKLGNTEQDFNFQQNREQNFQENSTQYIFQQPHEAKLESMITHEAENDVDDDEEGELKSLDEVYSQLRERHVSRSRSDTKPSAGEAPVKLPTKMNKSASMKSPFAHFEEEDIVETRRPATTGERNHKSGDGDNEVDAKADDFINKFKQQLKLQRLDSILRYKEMIGRGS